MWPGEPITAREERDVILIAARPDLAMTWSRYGPGELGPEPHVHREHTDSFYVLEGELTFLVGPDLEEVVAGPGVFVSVPPDVIHSFANRTADHARFLNIHTPDGGFAAFMRGMRDGEALPWDSHDPPEDGGLPASDAIVARPMSSSPGPGLGDQ